VLLDSPLDIIERTLSVPSAATSTGELRLTFSAPHGLEGAGRGNQIAEVWLMKR